MHRQITVIHQSRKSSSGRSLGFLEHGAANLEITKLNKSFSHFGQGLVRLLRGAAVRLSDITEGEGHVLKGKVAIRRKEGGRRKRLYLNNKEEELGC